MNIAAAIKPDDDRIEIEAPSLDDVELDPVLEEASPESDAELQKGSILSLLPQGSQNSAVDMDDPDHWRNPVPASYAYGIDPRWDVAQIASPGHMLTARVQDWSHRKYTQMILLGVAAFALFIGGQVTMPVLSSSPRWITNALTFDPNTYFSLGGGLRGGPNVAFMGNYPPRPESLSLDQYGDLVQAAAKDIGAHGYKAADWTAVGELKVAPKITRPEKVFGQWGERLKDGIIALPEIPAYATIVAHVQGQWGLTLVRANQCRTVQGPVVEGCDDATGNAQEVLSDQAITALEPMSPRQTQDQE